MPSTVDDYLDPTDALQQAAMRLGQPINGAFELTSRCNLACRMCYIRHAAHDVAVRARELTARQWVSLAEQATDAGLLFLLLTGGEIFLRPDFFDIYEPLTSLGLNLSLYTNGTLITPRVAKRLGSRPPNRVEITLYGASPETYAAVTGSADAFAQTLRGIDLLRDAGIALAVKTTLTRTNVQDLEAIHDLAHARNLPVKTGWLLTQRIDGLPCDTVTDRLSADAVVALEQADAKCRAWWTEVNPAGVDATSSEAMYCLAGKSAFALAPDGALNPCLDLPMPAARPLAIGFAAAWDEVREFVGTVPLASPCAACDVRAYCPTCPARTFVETRSLTGLDSYSCAIARARCAAFGASKEK